MAMKTTELFQVTATQINSIRLMLVSIDQDANEQPKPVEKQQRELKRMKSHLMSTDSRIAALEKTLKSPKIEFEREEQLVSDLGDTSKNEELLSMVEVEESQEPQPGPSSATE
eukprot:gene17052-8568_t